LIAGIAAVVLVVVGIVIFIAFCKSAGNPGSSLPSIGSLDVSPRDQGKIEKDKTEYCSHGFPRPCYYCLNGGAPGHTPMV